MKPIICPACKEPNEPKSRFCVNPKCMFVLSWDTYNQSNKEAERRKSELDEVKSKMLKLEDSVLLISKMMRQNLRGVSNRSEEAQYALDTASEMMERTEEQRWEREAAEKEQSE